MIANSDNTPGLFASINQSTPKTAQNKICRRSTRGRQPNGNANPIDLHIGNRIRLRRTLLGLSQERLAKLVGLTFQQVQKYERGHNRVSGSRFWDLARTLSVNVSYFFDDMDAETAGQSPRMMVLSPDQLNEASEEEMLPVDPMQKEETIELVRAYYKIPNRKLAKNLFDTIITSSKTFYPNEDSEDEIIMSS